MKSYFLNKKVIHWIEPIAACVVLVLLTFGFLFGGMSRNATTTVVFLLLLFSIVILNVCSWHVIENVFDRVSHQKEVERQKQQMENIVRLSRQTQEHREKVFKIQHDLKNHLSIVYSMLSDGNAEQAREYIRKLRLSFLAEDTKNDH